MSSNEALSRFNMALTQGQFDKIASMLYAAAKITLQAGKEELVKSRLQKRLLQLGLPGFDEYIRLVNKDPAELYRMVDMLTTNKTSFFRENLHFDFLRQRVLPQLSNSRVRIWSAGCSSGEEAYSIAMVIKDFFGDDFGDARVLATDLSERVLAKARAGIYEHDSMCDIPQKFVTRYFDCVELQKPRRYCVRQSLRSLISFAPLNLMCDWPMRGPFDVIFCRNVMIYFDKPTQEILVNRFFDLLSPGGYLFVGHSESLAGFATDFKYIQPAIHLKEKKC